MTPHLTHEQLCDLLLSGHSRDAWILSSPELDAARNHIQTCEACAEEFATLTASMQLFRSTANAWSSQQWSDRLLAQSNTLKPVASGSRFGGLFPRPLLWAASAALAIAIAAPFALHRTDAADSGDASIGVQPAHGRSAVMQSDEALLEEINQTLSSSVPSPMQPLADPTRHAGNLQKKD